jgi:catechol 2,3-dioxygenase
VENKYHKDAIHVRKIELIVRDLNRSLDYYTNSLGFQVKEKTNVFASLTTNNKDEIIKLIENKEAIQIDKQLGLYHFALLLPSRKELGKFLKHVIEKQIPITGAADHLVSEAIYLQDPDGIGIEVYSDRGDSFWYTAEHKINMDTQAFDYSGVYYEPTDSDMFLKLPSDTIIGHLHLQVKDLTSAGVFYSQILGFQIMTKEVRDAIFMSDKGYHHHIAINAWISRDAKIKQENSLGLKSFTIQFPTCETMIFALDSLKTHNIEVLETEYGYLTKDFENNMIYLELIN